MKITREWLDSKAACTSAVDAFLAVFPNGADLTRELLDHDVVRPHHDWLAGDLPLTASARATYDAATAQAWATYDAAKASAWATYDAAKASAWAAYEAAIASAWAAYDAAKAPALWDAIVASGLNDTTEIVAL